MHCKSPCLGKFQLLLVGYVDIVLKRGVTQLQKDIL